MRMRMQHVFLSLAYLFFLFILLPRSTGAEPIGICYGRVASNLPPPSAIMDLLQSNGISRLRLFDADTETLRSVSGTGISLMIGVPNEALPFLARGTVTSSLEWLQSNIFDHISPTQIRYIAVGNEIFLTDPSNSSNLVPAIVNLFRALQILGLHEMIKLSSPHASSILTTSYPPSAGTFDSAVNFQMRALLQFLRQTGSSLMVNLYPFFSHIANREFVSLDYALFRSTRLDYDGELGYQNLLDATIDAFVHAMEREGFYGIPVVVSETGWPTGGDEAAGVENALAYNRNVVRRSVDNVGTPKRPGVGVEVFLFDMFDENEKGGNEFERHFGIFGLDGVKVYGLHFN